MIDLTIDSEWTTSEAEFYSCETSSGNVQIKVDDVDENGESYRKSRATIKLMMLYAKPPIINKKMTMRKWALPIKKF